MITMGVFGPLVQGVVFAGLGNGDDFIKESLWASLQSLRKVQKKLQMMLRRQVLKIKSFMSDTAEGVKDQGQAASKGSKGILAFGAAFLYDGCRCCSRCS